MNKYTRYTRDIYVTNTLHLPSFASQKGLQHLANHLLCVFSGIIPAERPFEEVVLKLVWKQPGLCARHGMLKAADADVVTTIARRSAA